MHRLLIVDDDAEIRSELASYIKRYKIEVFEAADAEEAKKILLQEDICIATVDILMPGENGLDLTRWIVNEVKIPVILLTSVDGLEDKVAGLEIGADDYLVKPFEARELLARARAVCRRQKRLDQDGGASDGKTPDFINTPELRWQLNELTQVLQCSDGREFVLPGREFILLKILLDSIGETISKANLTRKIYRREWGPDDRGVDNLVVKLRRRIESDPSCPRYIVTIRNEGYRLQSTFMCMT